MAQSGITVRDDFEDGIVASLWTASATGSATVAETGGQAVFTLPNNVAGAHQAQYLSNAQYNLTGVAWPINIGTMVATGVAATAFYQWFTGNNILNWRQVSNTISANYTVNGVSTTAFSATWNATTYKYVRIREAGAFIFWDSSTDGITWTARATIALTALFPITALFIHFGASCGQIVSPGSFRINDVNLLLPAPTTNWRWVRAKWPFFERTQTVTMATGNQNTIRGYLVISDAEIEDANHTPTGNVRYYAGPMEDGRILTEQPSLAAAQAMAFNLPIDGRLDLPEIVQTRCWRLYLQSLTGTTVTLREIFPQRIVVADMIKAGAIVALHIGVIDLDAQHRITAGDGNVTLDERGVTLDSSTAYITTKAIDYKAENGSLHSSIYAQRSPTPGDYNNGILVLARMSPAGVEQSYITISTSSSAAPFNKQIGIIAQGGIVIVDSAHVDLRGGLSLTPSIPPIRALQGQIITTGIVAFNGAAINNNIALNLKGVGTTNVTTAIQIVNSASALNFKVDDAGRVYTRAGVPWDLGAYSAGTVTATGKVAVVINGTTYQLLAKL